MKFKVRCRGDLQIYEILMSWKTVNWLNRRSKTTHRQHGETRA